MNSPAGRVTVGAKTRGTAPPPSAAADDLLLGERRRIAPALGGPALDSRRVGGGWKRGGGAGTRGGRTAAASLGVAEQRRVEGTSSWGKGLGGTWSDLLRRCQCDEYQDPKCWSVQAQGAHDRLVGCG